MKKILLFILLLPVFASAQRTIVIHGDTIFVKAGTDSATFNKITASGKRFAGDYGLFMDGYDALLAAKAAKATTDSMRTNIYAGLNGKEGTISVLSFAKGGISGAAATSATTGTMTVSMTTSVITITPTGACTFNASGGVAGQRVTFAITTSGTSSFTLTFGTNFRKTGTLATGTTSARFFSVTFVCIDGTVWQEVARTAAQT